MQPPFLVCYMMDFLKWDFTNRFRDLHLRSFRTEFHPHFFHEDVDKKFSIFQTFNYINKCKQYKNIQERTCVKFYLVRKLHGLPKEPKNQNETLGKIQKCKAVIKPLFTLWDIL